MNTDFSLGLIAPAKRHQFDIVSPVSATGFRLIAPGGAAIDELELYTHALTPNLPIPPLAFHLVPGFTVNWNGNDGANFSANGASVPNNLALAANGGVSFSSGDLGPQISVPFHRAINLNDGLYGNANSWIGSDDAPSPFNAGVMLPGLFDVTSIAWGRDNGLDNANGECCNGQLTDRALGTYTIQRTLDGVSWDTVGILDYTYGVDDTLGGGFTPYFRHEFSLSDGDGGILARGLRVLVPTSGIGEGTAIDEIEIYGTPVPEPASATLMLGGLAVVAGSRRKRA